MRVVAERRIQQAGMPDLVAEIFGGRATRSLPEGVQRALEFLDQRSAEAHATRRR